MATLEKTYLYLRLGIVAATVLLLTGVVVQTSRTELLGSISAYYYTGVRDVFVGSVLAAALGLVVVRGRPGVENVLLNLAGMLLPVVAFIPTPLAADTSVAGVTVRCAEGWKSCVPEALVPDVVANLTTLVVLGAVGLVVAWVTLRGNPTARRGDRIGFLAAAAIWVLVMGLLAAGADSGARAVLLNLGHYVAAVLAFALLVIVGVVNGMRSDQTLVLRQFQAPFSRAYWAIAVLMTLTVVVGVVGALTVGASGTRLVLVVEVLLLVLFALFWLLQTLEFRRLGVPSDALDADAGGRTTPPAQRPKAR